MTHIIRLPDIHQAYYEARMILRHPMATDEEVQAALGVLINSPDWMDMDLCRQVQRAMQPKHGTRELTDAEMMDVWTRAPIRPTVTDYRAEVLPLLAFAAMAMIVIGLFLAI